MRCTYRMPLWTMSLSLVVGGFVLAGCQQTTIETSGGAVELDEPAVSIEQASTVDENQAVETGQPGAATRAPVAPTPAVVTARPAVIEPAVRPAAVPPRPQVTSAPAPVLTPAEARPVSVTATVPTRTVLPIELEKTLSSHSSQVGEHFRASLVQDIAVDGEVVFARGSVVLGRVTEAKPARKVGGRARLSLDFYAVQLADGREVPIEVQFAEAGKSQTPKDAAIIGGSTLGGAVIGHAVDEGEGTVIGAIVGGLAGAAAANETRARPVVLNSGTLLSLETLRPIPVTFER